MSVVSSLLLLAGSASAGPAILPLVVDDSGSMSFVDAVAVGADGAWCGLDATVAHKSRRGLALAAWLDANAACQADQCPGAGLTTTCLTATDSDFADVLLVTSGGQFWDCMLPLTPGACATDARTEDLIACVAVDTVAPCALQPQD